jgi:hypothetical protein
VTDAVWKYSIGPDGDDGTFTLEMPYGARVLAVQPQGFGVSLWALVNVEAQPQQRHFRIIATGAPFDDRNLEYVGTFQVHGGKLVFHLFEVIL